MDRRLLAGWKLLTRVATLEPRWRRALLGAPLLVVGLVAAFFVLRPGVAQPIAFNHRKHTQDLKLECEFCHQYVKTGAHPGLPAVETCAMCHQATLGTSPEAAKLTAAITAGQPVVFLKLFRLAPYVFYTHRRHVGIAQLECSNCHGAIALTTRPPSRPLVHIRMRLCLDCHARMRQTVDCVACHR